MIVWGIYDTKLRQYVGLGGRHKTKKEANKELATIQKRYKGMGWNSKHLIVKKKDIKYR